MHLVRVILRVVPVDQVQVALEDLLASCALLHEEHSNLIKMFKARGWSGLGD